MRCRLVDSLKEVPFCVYWVGGSGLVEGLGLSRKEGVHCVSVSLPFKI